MTNLTTNSEGWGKPAPARPVRGLARKAPRAGAAAAGGFALDTPPIFMRALLRAARRAMFWVCLLSQPLASLTAAQPEVKHIKADAERGLSAAQCLLARMYENGDRVHEDYSLAACWYRKAADQNSARAQYSLGRLYAEGLGVSQDYSEAISWFRKAAAQGYALAQNRLGVLYERGEGVAQDSVEAYKWFTLASGQPENVFAIANRDALGSRMSTAQIAEAKQRAELLVAQDTTARARK